MTISFPVRSHASTAPGGYAPGTWVILDLVDGDGDPLDDDHGALGRVLDSNVAATTVRLLDGRVRTVCTGDMHRAELRDASGRTTGRWKVSRIGVFWFARPIAAGGPGSLPIVRRPERGPLPHLYVAPTQAEAFEYAVAEAQRNIR